MVHENKGLFYGTWDLFETTKYVLENGLYSWPHVSVTISRLGEILYAYTLLDHSSWNCRNKECFVTVQMNAWYIDKDLFMTKDQFDITRVYVLRTVSSFRWTLGISKRTCQSVDITRVHVLKTVSERTRSWRRISLTLYERMCWRLSQHSDELLLQGQGLVHD